jgi:UDP-N-acetylglucosamine--N-acetylmuramyl-(pentapeptide) pyrophosphoryl-undecaprenol N-acetylglucosamine transferase
MLVGWVETNRPHIFHQAGSAMLRETKLLYRSLDLLDDATCRVVSFIEDMAEAYTWADLVICRSGASTVSELAAVGCASILIPYPYHHDQQQTLNARWLTQKDAAYLIHQVDLSPKAVLDIVKDLDCNRDKLFKIGQRARSMAVYDASDVIVEECMELVDAG